MKIIYNFTGSPVTASLFKLGVVDIPTFLKEEMKNIDDSVFAGKNTTENGTRLALATVKDAAPKGALVGILIPDSTPYREWKLVTHAASKIGIDVYIDSEM